MHSGAVARSSNLATILDKASCAKAQGVFYAVKTPHGLPNSMYRLFGTPLTG